MITFFKNLFGWKHTNGKAKVIRDDLPFEERFRWVLDRFKVAFPEPAYTVTGERIQKETGYGIFVSDGKHKSCFQVCSQILVNGKSVRSSIDLANEPKKQAEMAILAVRKGLEEANHREATRNGRK